MLRGLFPDSLLAEQLNQRKRVKRRITVEVNVDPQSKKRLHTAEADSAFHNAVEEALTRQGRRRPFAVPVAVRMHFQVGIDRQEPQIYQLPKHYLDLLQAKRYPNDRSPKLLLQDDRLVKCLICTYSFADAARSRPHVSFETTTLKDFVQELLLYDRIVNRDTGEEDTDVGGRLSAPEDPYGYAYDPVRDYREALKQRDSLSGNYRVLADMMLPTYQMDAQSRILGVREPQPVQIARIYEPLLKRRGIRGDVFQPVAGMIRQVFSIGVASADLGAPPARPGESDLFKERVRVALAEMRQSDPLWERLLTTMGITILYVPPKFGQKIDLDNLAMRIVPQVCAELKPPATVFHALRNFKPNAVTGVASDRLDALRRVEKIQVTRYQAFELPRLEKDPPEGNVRLLLHGRNEYTDPWDRCREAVDAWAKRLRQR